MYKIFSDKGLLTQANGFKEAIDKALSYAVKTSNKAYIVLGNKRVFEI